MLFASVLVRFRNAEPASVCETWCKRTILMSMYDLELDSQVVEVDFAERANFQSLDGIWRGYVGFF